MAFQGKKGQIEEDMDVAMIDLKSATFLRTQPMIDRIGKADLMELTPTQVGQHAK